MTYKISRAVSAVLVGSGLLLLNGAQPAKADANYLYNLGDFTDSDTNIITVTTLQRRGFSFTIPTGYQATFSQLGLWVKDASYTNARASVSLFSSENSNVPILTRGLNSQSTGDNSCTISNGAGRNDFCWNNLPAVVTLASGTYNLISGINSSNGNQNTYFVKTLTSPLEFVDTANNVVWGSPMTYDGTSFTADSGSAYGFFGPNLGSLTVTALPVPGVAVPAPLPLFGGIAAVAWSRRIKNRIVTTKK